jgi:alkylation response protein AidB-like acyl-CoA dehydrogenase
MVDFTLTEEQANLREMAHDFAEREIRPVAWDYDRDRPVMTCAHKLRRRRRQFPT